MPMRFALECLPENNKTVVEEDEYQCHGHTRGRLASVRPNAEWNADQREADRSKRKGDLAMQLHFQWNLAEVKPVTGADVAL